MQHQIDGYARAGHKLKLNLIQKLLLARSMILMTQFIYTYLQIHLNQIYYYQMKKSLEFINQSVWFHLVMFLTILQRTQKIMLLVINQKVHYTVQLMNL